MLVVRVEMWPHGDETRKETIATGIIINDGTSDSAKLGNYNSAFTHGDWDPHKLYEYSAADQIRLGAVKNHFRLQESVWSLVAKCIKAWLP